jgi:HTH-type transcriptional regulator/antitoxin HipB
MAKKARKSKPSASSVASAVQAQGAGLTFLSSAAEIGAAVRAARGARGLTQDEVADKAKVSRKFVIDVENGKDSLHLGKVLAVLMSAGLVGVIVPAESMKR